MVLYKLEGGLEKRVVAATHVEKRSVQGIYYLYIKVTFAEFGFWQVVRQHFGFNDYVRIKHLVYDFGLHFAVHKFERDVGDQSRLKMTFQERLSDANSVEVKGLDAFVERDTLHKRH